MYLLNNNFMTFLDYKSIIRKLFISIINVSNLTISKN